MPDPSKACCKAEDKEETEKISRKADFAPSPALATSAKDAKAPRLRHMRLLRKVRGHQGRGNNS